MTEKTPKLISFGTIATLLLILAVIIFAHISLSFQTNINKAREISHGQNT